MTEPNLRIVPPDPGASLLEAALSYASGGIEVFPVITQNKMTFPLTKHGFKEASTDPQVITAMFAGTAANGIGLHHESLVVIDVDDPTAVTADVLEMLERSGAPKQRTFRGYHFVFVGDGTVKQGTKVLPGIDTRTGMGYIHAAPTVHKDGGENVYHWETSGGIPTIPFELRKLLPSRDDQPSGSIDAGVHAVLGSGFELPDWIPDGQRHDIVYRYACSLRARGFTFTQAVRAMRELMPRIESTPRRPYELSDAIHELDQAWTLDGPSARVQSETLQAPTDDADEAEDATSEFRDLSWALLPEDQWPKPRPGELLSRADGKCLFYRGKVNGIYGAPESGKTWIALAAIVEEVKQGGFAVFVDIDHNGSEQLVLWLAALGLEPAAIADPSRFRLYEPDGAAQYRITMKQLIDEKPTLLVVDSIGELLPMLGLKSLDNDEVRRGLRPLALFADETGCCIITVDHITKDAGNTKYAIGAGGKKAMVNGSYIYVDAITQPVPGRIGKLKLTIEKDRLGGVRADAEARHWGTATMDSTGDGVVLVIDPPTSIHDIVRDEQAEAMILAAMEDCRTIRELVERTGYDKSKVHRILSHLYRDKRVRRDKRGSYHLPDGETSP
jgi:hypothetical protein